MKNAAQNDPLVKAQRKAYRESAVGQLETVLKEMSRWKKKRTIAENKVKALQTKVALIGLQLAREADRLEAAPRGDILKRASLAFVEGSGE